MFENFKKLSVYAIIASRGLFFLDRDIFFAESAHIDPRQSPALPYDPVRFSDGTNSFLNVHSSFDEAFTAFSELDTSLDEPVSTDSFRKMTVSARIFRDKEMWEKSSEKYLEAERIRRESGAKIYDPIQRGMLKLIDHYPNSKDGTLPPGKVSLFVSLLSLEGSVYSSEALSKLHGSKNSFLVGSILLKRKKYQATYDVCYQALSEESVLRVYLKLLELSLNLAHQCDFPRQSIPILEKMLDKFKSVRGQSSKIDSILNESELLLGDLLSYAQLEETIQKHPHARGSNFSRKTGLFKEQTISSRSIDHNKVTSMPGLVL